MYTVPNTMICLCCLDFKCFMSDWHKKPKRIKKKKNLVSPRSFLQLCKIMRCQIKDDQIGETNIFDNSSGCCYLSLILSPVNGKFLYNILGNKETSALCAIKTQVNQWLW